MKVRLTVSIDKMILEHIDETAKQLNMSRSAYVNLAFTQGMSFAKKMQEYADEQNNLIGKK